MRPSTEETMGPGGHRGRVLVCASVRVCEGFVHVREVWTTTCRGLQPRQHLCPSSGN